MHEKRHLRRQVSKGGRRDKNTREMTKRGREFIQTCQLAQTLFDQWLGCFDEDGLKNYFSQLAEIRRSLDSIIAEAVEIDENSVSDEKLPG